MSYYTFRCDRQFYNQVLSFYKDQQQCEMIMCVEENPSNKNENIHVHGMFKSSKSKAALDKARQRVFIHSPKMKGQKAWSSSLCRDKEGYINYMCKGCAATKSQKEHGKYTLDSKSDVKVLLTHLPPDEIIERHEKFWTERAEGTTPFKKQKITWVDKLTKRFESEFNVQPSTDEPSTHLPDAINNIKLSLTNTVEWILDNLSIDNKPWGPKLVQDVLRLFIWRYKSYFSYNTVMKAKKVAMSEIIGNVVGYENVPRTYRYGALNAGDDISVKQDYTELIKDLITGTP